MSTFPTDKLGSLARQHGLKSKLVIKKHPRSAWFPYFDHRTGIIYIKRFSFNLLLAHVVAHEIKHKIDYDNNYWGYKIPYRSLFFVIAIATTLYFNLWWIFFITYPIAKILHPLELSANWYSHRHLHEYHKILAQD